jgi:malonyl-CoA decarboxylase
MVNYRYDLKDIERNHEAYANEGVVAAARQVQNLLKVERSRPEAATTKLLQIARLRTGRPGAEDDERR